MRRGFRFFCLKLLCCFVFLSPTLAQPTSVAFVEGHYKTIRYGSRFVIGAVAADNWNEARRKISKSQTNRLNTTYYIAHRGRKNIYVYIWYIDSNSRREAIQAVQCDTNNGQGWVINGEMVRDGDSKEFNPPGSNCVFVITNADNRTWSPDTILYRVEYPNDRLYTPQDVSNSHPRPKNYEKPVPPSPITAKQTTTYGAEVYTTSTGAAFFVYPGLRSPQEIVSRMRTPFSVRDLGEGTGNGSWLTTKSLFDENTPVGLIGRVAGTRSFAYVVPQGGRMDDEFYLKDYLKICNHLFK